VRLLPARVFWAWTASTSPQASSRSSFPLTPGRLAAWNHVARGSASRPRMYRARCRNPRFDADSRWCRTITVALPVGSPRGGRP
jgi:hypothetical protein